MNKITTIHLNGKATQLEEEGYEALRSYLARAESQLKDNPDKTEILADLEQAIAEKCGKFLNAGKDIVTAQEVREIIQEMGPVDGPNSDAPASDRTESPGGPSAPKRLYLIREGAVFAGVCNGLAAYFNIDVVIVRIAFVALTILTGGAWILVYAALMFTVPYATTSEERAEAHGEVFNAQEVVNRAKESYSRLTNKEGWKKSREEWRHWKHEYRREKARAKAAAWRDRFESRMHRRSMRVSPALGFVSMMLAILWMVALISLIQTGAIFGWMVTAYIPLWAAIVLLFIVYHAVTGPMRARQWMRMGNQWYPYDGYDGWHGVADGLGVLFLVIVSWFAYTHVPEVRAFINDLPRQFQQVIDSIRQK